MDEAINMGISKAEETGIIFIDEIERLQAKTMPGQMSPGRSSENILPILKEPQL